MADVGQVRKVLVMVAIGAGVVLALARFLSYVDFVNVTDVEFEAALTWWALWVSGTALLVAGGLAVWTATPIATDWAMLFVGLLVLAIMPAAPVFGFSPFG